MATAEDHIALPMAGNGPVRHFRRALLNADHLRDLATSIRASAARPARLAVPAQMAQQLATQFTVWLHVQIAVNRLCTHMQTRLAWIIPSQAVSDLHRQPLFAQQAQYSLAQSAVHSQSPRLAITAPLRLALGGHCPVIKARSVPCQFSADGRWTTAQRSGNAAKAVTLGIFDAEFFAFGKTHAKATFCQATRLLYTFIDRIGVALGN